MKSEKGKARKGLFQDSALPFYLIFADCIEMMGLIGAGNNPMVGMTVAVAVAVQEALQK